ncbi:hypothetical protein GCM10011390_10560 [Aureimonas endophytica]|uniref:Bacteriophage phiJL001 Gp84 C-terminal domain-containing protein n=1 Tax=Aureimonas endophytica TaxID=2027858 RepID=A0A916ZFE5_9HYPH|nr:DUF2163 domain-containing protein [Aureimonas endophytica]GGD93690.1 hypothetical protein GCM10011390_10560 [Aureimonas endophytica]
MRTVPKPLAAHLAASATTLCQCWRLTRRDGTVLGFTDHDEALAFDGTVFEAASGLSASEAEAELGLAAGTREVSGALSSTSIAEKDILAGRYDGAEVETFLVNWSAPEQHLLVDKAELGEVKRGDSAFTAELRGLASRLDRRRGRLYRRRCDAQFGDAGCGIDTARADLFLDAVVSGIEEAGAAILAPAGPVDPALYAQGRVSWRSGEGAGLSSDIAGLQLLAGGAIRLVPLGGLSGGQAPGDAARLHAGCDKSFATCRARFANGLNFRGFPHLPGNDRALAIAKEDGRHDGGPVVP